MSPTKKTTRSTAKKASGRRAKTATKRVTKRPGARKMSAAHKKALAEGRAMSATVDRYLAAVNTPKRRGRKVSKASLMERLSDARTRQKKTTGVERVLAAQEARNLHAKLAQLRSAGDVDTKGLEVEFVRVAKKFGENRGIRYGAWRDAGVPAEVLKRAGIARTRG